MNKYYKIKVGIEEFTIGESDIPRIVEAMQTNSMVRLEAGLFRGQAILAVCRDAERESLELALHAPVMTPEEIELQARKKQIERQQADCTKCDKNGWEVFLADDGEHKVCRCVCQKIS